MQITITATVPDELRDETDDVGLLSGPHDDLVDGLISSGVEITDITIRAEER